jgi:putative ABC transport system ATP-binding protein
MIKLANITKIYPMGETKVNALREINLTIQTGEFVAIMGASGSGKSTLMNIIGCLDIPTSGTFTIDNTNISTCSKNQLAAIRNRTIGFVFQGFNLLSRTSAVENVELPLLYNKYNQHSKNRERAIHALSEVGLNKHIHHEPTQLSGGQQQRVAIARALINDPKIILADEPTGNLDSITSIDIMSIFQRLNDTGITIILVTHEADIANYAKRIIEVKDGRIIRDDTITKRSFAVAIPGNIDRSPQ